MARMSFPIKQRHMITSKRRYIIINFQSNNSNIEKSPVKQRLLVTKQQISKGEASPMVT